MKDKPQLREEARRILQKISAIRRSVAQKKLEAFFDTHLKNCSSVLSFSSLPLEISTASLNANLEKSGLLYLPKVTGDTIEVYKIISLKDDLEIGSFGILEPISQKCQKVDPNTLEIILVPGLLFDSEHNRLGYGKGHFDRFLKNLKCTKFWGIGFLEQEYPLLPTNSLDVPLHNIYLF